MSVLEEGISRELLCTLN